MENRHTVEALFGSEFLSNYNDCGVNDGVKSQDVTKIFQLFCFLLLEKRSLTVKIFKLLFRSFHPLTDRRVVLKFREFWPTGNRCNRALPT